MGGSCWLYTEMTCGVLVKCLVVHVKSFLVVHFRSRSGHWWVTGAEESVLEWWTLVNRHVYIFIYLLIYLFIHCHFCRFMLVPVGVKSLPATTPMQRMFHGNQTVLSWCRMNSWILGYGPTCSRLARKKQWELPNAQPKEEAPCAWAKHCWAFSSYQIYWVITDTETEKRRWVKPFCVQRLICSMHSMHVEICLYWFIPGDPTKKSRSQGSYWSVTPTMNPVRLFLCRPNIAVAQGNQTSLRLKPVLVTTASSRAICTPVWLITFSSRSSWG